MKFLPHHIVSVSASVLLLAAGSLRAQVTYTYNGADTTSGNNWSNDANWTPTPTGSTGPGGTSVATTDSAYIGTPLTGNQIVTYDTGAQGYLLGLSIVNTGTYTSELDIQKSLDVYDSVTVGGAGSGPIRIVVDDTYGTVDFSLGNPPSPAYFDNTLTLNANSTLELENAAAGTAPGVYGKVTIAGGTVDVDDSYASGKVVSPTFYDPVTMTSGAIILNTAPGYNTAGSTTPSMRFTVNGGLFVTGAGSSITSAIETTVNDQIWLGGPGAMGYFGTGVTFDTNIGLYLVNNSSQSFYSGVTLGAVTDQLATNAGSSSPGGYSRTLTLGAAGSTGAVNPTGTLTMGSFYFGGTEATGNVETLVLASNVTTATGALQIEDADGAYLTGTFTTQLDLATHVLDERNVSTAAGTVFLSGDDGGTFAPEYSNAVGSQYIFNINDTGDTTGTGGIYAQAFDLHYGLQVNVNGYTNLMAVGAGMANNLGGGGTISANSTFFYNASSGSNTTIGTLTSNRAIGALHVGYSGTATGSRLQLLSAITTQGNVQVDSGAILDVSGQILTLSGASVATGAGLITSGVAGGSVTWASGSTGGLEPGSAIGSTTAQQLSFTGTAGGPLAVTLLSTSVSNFNIKSGTSFDSISLGANVALTNAGSLVLDFTSGYTPTNGTTLDLFAMAGGTDTGSFSSITSNIAGDSFTLNDTTGMLTISAVPEPSSMALLLGTLAVGAFGWRLRRLRGGLLVNR